MTRTKTSQRVGLSGALAVSLAMSSPASAAPPPSSAAPPPTESPESRVVPPVDPPPASCVPACREGFVCVEGACVSACNPPCPDDQTCTADAQCVPPSTTPSAGPQPEPQSTPTPESVDGACVADSQCRHPRQCESGRCTITQTYLDGLRAQAKAGTITGAVLMGIGGLIALSSIAAFASGKAKSRRGESDDSAFVAGYSLLGVGGLVIIGGSIPLGIGTGKSRRWRAYSRERDAAR